MVVISAVLFVAASAWSVGQGSAIERVIPKPTSGTETGGTFTFPKSLDVASDPSCQNERAMLAEMLDKAKIRLRTAQSKQSATMVLEIDRDLDRLGDEGYKLVVVGRKVTIAAPRPAGVFYGIQTLRQLLPQRIEDPTAVPTVAWTVPCVSIEDSPRFAWRGVMLDDSRHFFPKASIEKLIDLMAMEKMNVFHWHFNDDGGWRIQIKKYPNLTDWGAWRRPSDGRFPRYTELSFPGRSTGETLYGGFHTQEDVKEIVQFAARRHVTVVPEFEVPGHNLAATRSYPFLVCSPDLAAGFRKEEGFEFPNIFCAGKESTYTFCENVLDELLALFPSKFVHIGGDEVDKYLWTHCPDCLRAMKEHGFTDASQLESYFVNRVGEYLKSKGRRYIGWDEIMEGGLPAGAAVMAWRDVDAGAKAAKAGHDVVMTPLDDLYMYETYERLPTSHVFAYDPIPQGLTADEAKHILGAEACFWTESIFDLPTLEDLAFPRTLALAEVLWSGPGSEPAGDFERRVDTWYERYSSMGVRAHLPAPRVTLNVVAPSSPGGIDVPNPAPTMFSVRYTTDGSDPTPASPVLHGPIHASENLLLRAALFDGQGRHGPVGQVRVANVAPVAAQPSGAGLLWKLFDGSWSAVPAFARLTPVASGVTSSIGIVGNRQVNYGLELSGFLRVAASGAYRLALESDDGSVMWLGGFKVVDNDGLHGSQVVSTRLFLREGTYPIRIGFIQAGEDARLAATIEGPGIKLQPIPASMLAH